MESPRKTWIGRRLFLLAAGAGALLRADGRQQGGDALSSTGRGSRHGLDEQGGRMHAINVLDHGAAGNGITDDTQAIQNVIDASRGKIVTFPHGVYLVSKLLLGDDTHLDLRTSIIRRHENRDGGSGGATIRNADFINGNTNVTVTGGTVEGGVTSTGRLINFVNCSNVRLCNVNLGKGASPFVDWMCVVEGCDDVIVTGINISGGRELGEDGLHIKSSSKVVVANCIVDSGDDAIAIVQEFNQSRPIHDISITNCVVSSKVAHMIRISVFRGESQGIEGVVLSNIVGRGSPSGSAGNPVLINDDTNSGLLQNVSIDNVVISAGQTVGDAWRMVNVRNTTVRGVRVSGAGAHAFLVNGCESITFTDCHAYGPQPLNGNPAWTIADCGSISLGECSAADAGVHSFEIARSSRVQLLGCRSMNPAGDGFYLAQAETVVIAGCIGVGGVAGVHCDAAAPSTRVAVSGCVITGQSGQAFRNQPIENSYVGNVGES